MSESRESFDLRVSEELAELYAADPVGYGQVRWPSSATDPANPHFKEVAQGVGCVAPLWLLSQLWQEEFGYDP
jgi:hypothetical protein